MGSICCKQQEVPVERMQVIRHCERPAAKVDTLTQELAARAQSEDLRKQPSQAAHEPTGLHQGASQHFDAKGSGSPHKAPSQPEAADDSADVRQQTVQKDVEGQLVLKMPNGTELEVARQLLLQPEVELLDSDCSKMLSHKADIQDEESTLWLDIYKDSHIQALVTHIGDMMNAKL